MLDGRVSMFVGMDLHKNYLQIAVINEKGKVLENSRIKNNHTTTGVAATKTLRESMLALTGFYNRDVYGITVSAG